MRFGNNVAARGWDDLCSSAPNNARSAWERITEDPRRWDGRQKPLQGSYERAHINGIQMEQWQYEVTSGGRIWYCIDDAKQTVWVTHAGTGHPKATE